MLAGTIFNELDSTDVVAKTGAGATAAPVLGGQHPKRNVGDAYAEQFRASYPIWVSNNYLAITCRWRGCA